MMFTVFTCGEHEHFAGLKYLRGTKKATACAMAYVFYPALQRRGPGRGFYLLAAAGLATTSPTMLKYFVGVLAFDVTTIGLLNGWATAAL